MRVFKTILVFWVLSLCIFLPACLSKSSEEGSEDSTKKGTKSAYLIVNETALQSESRNGISATEDGDYILSEQAIGTTTTVIVTLSNSGDVAADKIKAFSVSSPLSYLGQSYPGTGGTCARKISPGETCTIVLAFTPTAMGENSAKLQIGYYNGKITRTFEKTFKANGFSIPTITNLTPAYGKITGGNAIVITGTHLFDGATVTVDGNTCAVTYSHAPTSLTCLAPAHSAGTATIAITNTDGKTGTSTLTYLPPPTVISVSPTAGALAGGTVLTVTGTGFVSGATASVGGNTCSSVSVLSSTTLTCITSAHSASTVDIVVTSPETSTATGANLYTYQPAPTVSSISQSSGLIGGGEYLTITGTNFMAGVSATVGGNDCVSLTRLSSTSLLCVVPAGIDGSTVDVTATNTDNQTGTGSGLYTYNRGESWTTLTTVNGPKWRELASTIWTGSKIFLVGGSSSIQSNIGEFYDPVTGSSTFTTSTNAPAGTRPKYGVWTGSKIILWGGYSSGYINTGGVYDPILDSWTATTTTNAPPGKDGPGVVWTGSHMLVFSGTDGGSFGSYSNTGGLYDPETNTWTLMTTTNAPSPSSIWKHEPGVWTGKYYINYNRRYNPITDTWTANSTTNAINFKELVFWTGKYVLVWGSTGSNVGGMYDPEADSWTLMTTVGAPSARDTLPTAVWTGSRMIVWGGNAPSAGDFVNTGGIFDPQTNSWEPMTTIGAPLKRRFPVRGVWTGSQLLIWGGYDYAGGPASVVGGLYTPPVPSTSNSWATMTTTGAPSPRCQHSGVWAGGKMIVFGGGCSGSYNDGGIYDPVTNNWSATTTVGAPPTTRGHGVIWTGSKMIVWGGTSGNVGGAYDPVVNSWTTLPTTGAPAQVSFHSQLWTGDKMIIWGGRDNSGAALNTGGIYHSASNSWTAINTTNSAAHGGLCVWTGGKMICYGGGNYTGITKSYELGTDSWTNLSSCAFGTLETGYVWTGKKMLVWGGHFGGISQNGGAIYDPDANSWSYMTTLNAPTPRVLPQTVWTGEELLVWGGSQTDGGRYNPATNTWKAMSTVNVPSARIYIPTIWTGSKLIIWGGAGSSTYNTGALYTP